jgi:hypothetical protein
LRLNGNFSLHDVSARSFADAMRPARETESAACSYKLPSRLPLKAAPGFRFPKHATSRFGRFCTDAMKRSESKETFMPDNQAHDGDTAVKNRKPSLIAYNVRDGRDDQSFWERVGAAWSNKDGGFTVQLHSIPLDGRIVLTKPKVAA